MYPHVLCSECYTTSISQFPRNSEFRQSLSSIFQQYLYHLEGKIPVVTMVWVVSRFRLQAPPDISSSCISPLTSSGQRSRASWASQSQKSATLSPQPGGKPRKFIRTCGGIGKIYISSGNSWQTTLSGGIVMT